MFRRITTGARASMPNVDGWDVLLWAAIALGFYGLWVTFTFGIACIVAAVVVGALGFLGSASTPPAPPTRPIES